MDRDELDYCPSLWSGVSVLFTFHFPLFIIPVDIGRQVLHSSPDSNSTPAESSALIKTQAAVKHRKMKHHFCTTLRLCEDEQTIRKDRPTDRYGCMHTYSPCYFYRTKRSDV